MIHRFIAAAARIKPLALIIALRAPALAGVDAWTPTGVPGTAVLTIAIDPMHSSVLYTGTFDTALKSTDRATSWAASSIGFPSSVNLQVSVLQIDPTAPTTLYAGTRGTGLFRSTDGGGRWQVAGPGRDGIVYALQIAPGLPTTLYAEVSGNGLIASTDGGTHWNLLNRDLVNVPLAIDPTTPSTIYAGRFKSTDGGGSWFAIGDNLPTAALTALAVDPAMPTTVYAGTRHAGVFKSTDGGITWRDSNAGLPDPNVTVLAIDPVTPTTLYAGTVGDGVFKSLDAGVTWFALPGAPDGDVTAIAIDPANRSLLYAVAAGQLLTLEQSGPHPAIAPTPIVPPSPRPNCSLALDPNHGAAGSVTRLTARCDVVHSGARADLYFGSSWVGEVAGETGGFDVDGAVLTVPSDAPAGLLLLRLIKGTQVAAVAFGVESPPMPPPGGNTWRFVGPGVQVIHTLALDPAAAATLYAGGEGGGIFKTTDGGVSWGVLRHGPAPTTPVYAIVIDSAVPATLYAGTGGQGVLKSTDAGNDWTAVNVGLANLDITALAADSSGTLFAASKVGVFTSTDDGASWSNPSSAPLQADVSALVADPHTPGTLYAATQGSGLFKTTDGGTHWSEANLVNRYVDGLAIDPLRPQIVYAGVTGVSKSIDGGVTWADASNGIAYSNGYTGVVVRSLVIDQHDPDTLWAGTYTAGIFKSTDGGGAWVPAETGLPDTAFSMVIDPGRPDTLYAAAYAAYKSTDGGSHWMETSLSGQTRITGVSVHPIDPATLYLAAYGAGVFRSTDHALTWSSVGRDVIDAYVDDVVVDPGAPSIVYVSSESGIFRSTDAGVTWATTTVRSAAQKLTAVAAPPTVYVPCLADSGWYVVCRSTDHGATWLPTGPESGAVSNIVVDPQHPTTLYGAAYHSYAVRDGGLYKSIDRGAHWTLTGLVSFDFVLPLAVDPHASNIVYASSRAGLLRSTDAGASWAGVYAGLPVRQIAEHQLGGAVDELIFDRRPGRLYAAVGQLYGSADGGQSWSQVGDDVPGVIVDFALGSEPVTTIYAGTSIDYNISTGYDISTGLYVLEPADLPTPTPTPTIDSRCAPDAITIQPSMAPPGGTVTVHGVCYFLHSGHHAAVYFDTTVVGAVTGDTLGAYELTFAVPTDALPGLHRVHVVGAQSALLTVEAGEPPTPTPTPDGFCPSQNITVVPSSAPAGGRVVVSGQCYWLHSGGGGEIDFDDVRLGSVRGGQAGDYAGVFQIPDYATPGAHTIAMVQSGTRQQVPFVVDAAVVLYRGDCNNDGTISVDELVRGVAIALGVIDIDMCPSFDVNADRVVTIDELVRAINRSFWDSVRQRVRQ